ncbi:MAG: ComEC family competence protein [Bacteroidetes bacterium]|nr:ComEC family competence protein [Bacteroidota bacterium]
MRSHASHLWQEAPFLRLLIPFIGGIVVEWYCSPPLVLWWGGIIAGFSFLVVFNLCISYLHFRLQWLNGLFIQFLLFFLGALLCWYRYPANGAVHLSRYYQAGSMLLVTIQEPLSEKEKTFRVIASVEETGDGHNNHMVSGDIVLYLQKNGSVPVIFTDGTIPVRSLRYGDRLLFQKALQPISNPNVPGAFDYKSYAARQGLYQQVYLRSNEFVIVPGRRENPFKKWLLHSREQVSDVLRRYIRHPEEAGMAEALLIGYKEDLDKRLLQSYANTGVVHVIAISGLHVALIYGLLGYLLAPVTMGGLFTVKALQWIKMILLLTGLWLFALLAGGSPSVLRAALMFSCMVAGERLYNKVSIYNTLAASAFILLCIDPFWCWDIGFQLSYAAVLSVVVFMQPLYGLLRIQNKSLKALWKLSATTLAAQVLTMPLCVYHFQQLPVYFLVTNLVAVPLSTFIIGGELLLCGLAMFPGLAGPVGGIVEYSIGLLNRFIRHMEQMPFSLYKGLQVNVLQLVLLYVVIAGLSRWLLCKSPGWLLVGLCGLLGIVSARAFLS